MQEVEILIENGTPTVSVKCVKGGDCKKITRGLEQALGEVQETRNTNEFYEKATKTVKIGR